MTYKLRQIIVVLFHVLFFAIPLILFPKTSELFEFNKIVFLYLITTSVAACWIFISIIEKKVTINRSLLDWPIIIFLSTQLLSSLLSIETRTSIFGYYSRWNGGLLSSLCYATLYWSFATFISSSQAKKLIYTVLYSTVLTSIYGILEHFGHSLSCQLITGKFDVDCWVQDVKLRVFSTFGQPNWLASWLVAITPLTWGLTLIEKRQGKRTIILYLFNIIFFATLIFTKSRSGLIAFALSAAIFWILSILLDQKNRQKVFKFAVISTVLIGLVAAIFGTPWTPKLNDLISKQQTIQVTDNKVEGPSLESGGTESGEIRKIVWSGAFNVWKIYPLFGSGVETFALSYYQGRPMAHNLTSEWNFLYNKAHNEYLNFLATTGLVGFTSYVTLICFSVYSFFKYSNSKKSDHRFLEFSLLGGFVGILVTNFFGFSVVTTSLLFFLFPAFAYSLQSNEENFNTKSVKELTSTQISELLAGSVFFILIIWAIAIYWRADYLYAKSTSESLSGDYQNALKDVASATSLSPYEPIYHATLSGYYADLAKAATESKDDSLSSTFKNASVEESQKTVELAQSNVKLLKQVANSYEDLGDIDSTYYLNAQDILGRIIRLAPTDPSAVYQKGLTEAKSDKVNEAIVTVNKAVQMKPDYKIARRLLAFLYENIKEKDKAKEQLEYILKYISPNDEDIKKELGRL